MPKEKFSLTGEKLTIEKLELFTKNPKAQISLQPEVIKKNNKSFKFLQKSASSKQRIIYGVNTGFGPMANYLLPEPELEKLQENLVVSHAVGLGEKIPEKFVLAAMLVRLNTLAKGYSGVSPQLLGLLAKFINLRIVPIVPEHGAVGTSGDLVQLAHIALALNGKGFVSYKGKVQKTNVIFKKLNLTPYKFKIKEGLSMINGTSMMSGIGALNILGSKNILQLAIASGCLALEITGAYNDSFSAELHRLRPHPGQINVAEEMRNILRSSRLINDRKKLNTLSNKSLEIEQVSEKVQEVYSFRCIAQVLGPVWETIFRVQSQVEIEINSVTDNPVVDFGQKDIFHGGNFHGDYIAVAMDQLKISVAKLTMLSERRLNYLLNPNIQNGFPPFLNLKTPGLTLGLQPLQFVATSTTANSQTLSYPMNLHSIPTNGDNQDVVSMGTDAALLTNKVIENAYIVLTVEMIALAQAVDYLKVENKLSSRTKKLYAFIRKNFPAILEDRDTTEELPRLVEKVKSISFDFFS